jgi:isoquinoline 1-oxidoreductase beta subunit
MDSLSPHGLRGNFDPSRRSFLIAMLGAGVILGYTRPGIAVSELLSMGTLRANSPGELFEPNIWYGIDPSGEVSVSSRWTPIRSGPR